MTIDTQDIIGVTNSKINQTKQLIA